MHGTWIHTWFIYNLNKVLGYQQHSIGYYCIHDACYYVIHSLSYTWRHSFWLLVFKHTTGIFHHFSHSNTYTDQVFIIYLHMHTPLAITPILLLTWHPPVVIGIVHLGPRLSVNCSPLFPIVPLCPPLQNPNPFSDFPEPNVHLIKARLNPLPSIPNNN